MSLKADITRHDFSVIKSHSAFCVCDSCHDTTFVYKLVVPITKCNRNGGIDTNKSNLWLCPQCFSFLIDEMKDCLEDTHGTSE